MAVEQLSTKDKDDKVVSLIRPTPEQQRERQRVEKLIRDRMSNTLGNEMKNFEKRKGKIANFRKTFTDKAIKSGRYKAAAEYVARMNRFNAMPDRFKQLATPPRPSKEASQQMQTIGQRFNTAVRRNMKSDLAAMDKFEKRSRQFEHDLRLKHDKTYRPNKQGGGLFGLFGSRPEDREGFRTQAAQHNPDFHKRQQRFIKKYGEDPQKYYSLMPGLPTQRDIREQAAFSRQFINRGDYDKARTDAWNRYNQWKRKQPRKPIRSPWPTFLGNNPVLPNSAFTPATSNTSLQQKQALFNNAQRDAQDKFNKSRDAQRAQFFRQFTGDLRESPGYKPTKPKTVRKDWISRTVDGKTIYNPTYQKLKVTPHVTRPSPKQPKITKPVLKQEGFKGKTGSDLPHGDPFGTNYIPSKPKKMLPVKQILKSGGKVTKTYANGGGVRKPKYNKKG